MAATRASSSTPSGAADTGLSLFTDTVFTQGSIAEKRRREHRAWAPTSFRPVIVLEGDQTHVLVEQTTMVDPQRLGRSAGRLHASELRAVDEALALVLGL